MASNNKGDFKFLDEIKVKFINVDIYGIPKRVTDKIYWNPDFHPDESYNKSRPVPPRAAADPSVPGGQSDIPGSSCSVR